MQWTWMYEDFKMQELEKIGRGNRNREVKD
jgi:hypothetical protein